MIAWLFWDNDGVLVDTEPLYYRANREVLREELGVDLDLEAFQRISLTEGRSVLEIARETGADDAEIERLRRLRNERYHRLLQQGPVLMPGIPDVLDRLGERFRMSVVTSSNHDHFEAMHRITGLLDRFAFALTNRDYGRTKPHPDPYLAALKHAGALPEEVLVLEDTERGLASALAAGLRCVVIPHGLTRNHTFRGAEAVLGSVEQLPGYLARFD